MFYRAVRFMLRILFTFFYRYKVAGRDRLPAQGGCIVVANHCSLADPLILGSALKRSVRFMAKAEIFSWPVLGLCVRWLHAFPVRRGAGDRRAIKTGLEAVRQGEVLGLFPEGTRFRDGSLHELRNGAAMMTRMTGAPIIPVGIVGSHRMKFLRFPRLKVYIGEALNLTLPEGLREREATAAVNKVIGKGLEYCLEQARKM